MNDEEVAEEARRQGAIPPNEAEYDDRVEIEGEHPAFILLSLMLWLNDRYEEEEMERSEYVWAFRRIRAVHNAVTPIGAPGGDVAGESLLERVREDQREILEVLREWDAPFYADLEEGEFDHLFSEPGAHRIHPPVPFISKVMSVESESWDGERSRVTVELLIEAPDQIAAVEQLRGTLQPYLQDEEES